MMKKSTNILRIHYMPGLFIYLLQLLFPFSPFSLTKALKHPVYFHHHTIHRILCSYQGVFFTPPKWWQKMRNGAIFATLTKSFLKLMCSCCEGWWISNADYSTVIILQFSVSPNPSENNFVQLSMWSLWTTDVLPFFKNLKQVKCLL